MRLARTLLAVLIGALAAGCSGILLSVANGADVVNGGYRRQSDVRYGSDVRQSLDVYRPTAGAPRALVVFVHGGRWDSGSKSQYRFLAAGLAARGFVVAMPNYRLAPAVHMPEAAEDVARAVAFAERSAGEWGVAGKRVVLMGHSAGAQLAALVAYDTRWLAAQQTRPVDGFAGFSGPYDFLPLTDADLIAYFAPPESYPASQPVNFVGKASPPAFLVQGLADRVVALKNTTSLARHLTDAGVGAEVHLMDGEDHAGVLKRFARFYRGHDPVYEELVRFLDGPAAHAPAG